MIGQPTRPAGLGTVSASAGQGRLRALLGLLILATLAGLGWLLIHWEPRLLPIRVIQIEGGIHHYSSQQLQERLTQRLQGGILTADLRALKDAAEDLPWIAHASLRRVWPDTLRVTIEEYRPIARWNRDGLVTAEGVVFRPQGAGAQVNLPLLEGEDKRASEVVMRYLQWQTALGRIGQGIQRLGVDARGDWRLTLASGVELRLGTTQIEERLARYLASARQLEAVGRPATVDLRYSNGFSVKWAPQADTRVRMDPQRVARMGQ
ncbi:FtsQ-type POTRA domain-containing protein [Caldichromatium japonicum]|uniref:Cell division protein FtsQ n=1 Tax=Caldichromatium japonicum TaxID=2699430 RepID=A0A6G7VES9_9GAMM|nr:cell division protein FtsQ/DivIB [Caldichromatium japonicum]QIK38376.1 FtsQ-type POTRA domain-containing protein [Caldichromatium japonicum]